MKLRIGMIGAGHIAQSHAKIWQNEAQITAVCSRQRHKAQRLASAYGIPNICDHAEELVGRDDVDIVSISTPHYLHHPQCLQAIEAGKHVFCEKPLALNATEAREMRAAAQKAGVKTGIQFSERVTWPSLIWLHCLIKQGALGEIQFFEGQWAFNWARDPEFPMQWRFKQDLAGAGALGDLGVYMIDAARWLIGEFTCAHGDLTTYIKERPIISELYDFGEVRRMAGLGKIPGSTGMEQVENDDACTIMARFDNGAQGSIRVSRLQRGNTIRVEGSEATCVWDLQSTRLLGRRYDEDLFTDIPIPKYIQSTSMVTQFLSNIVNDTDLPTTFDDGVRAQEVVDAVIRSADEGRWIDIEEEI